MSIAASLNIARRYARGGAVQTNPSLAQKDAGNFKMKHVSFQGIPISIENKKGTVRSGIDSNGRRWANRMTADYGYIKRTNGKDGDQVDCFVGPNRKSNKVWVLDQLHHQHKKFDEHKCLLGFNTQKQALIAYHGSYGRAYGKHHTVGGVTEMSVDAFKEWLRGGGGKKPVAPDVPQYQDGGVVEDAPVEAVSAEDAPATPDDKIGRDAFLYMNPKPPEDSFAQCGTCLMFTGTGCMILGKTEITKDMTCGLYVHGEPQTFMKGHEMDLVSPEEAGLVDFPVRCENCKYGGETCQLFETLNNGLSDTFNLDVNIDPKGCCNAFTRKGS